MAHYYSKPHWTDKQVPSVTGIISDATDKSAPLTYWSANMTTEWLRQNCDSMMVDDQVVYMVYESSLDKARRHFREVSQEALDVGSAVHDAIELWLKTGEEPIKPAEQVARAFEAFLNFAFLAKMETIETEYTVFGPCWAGTLDWFGELDGKLTVIDFKSSKGFYSGYGEQIAAYRSCLDGHSTPMEDSGQLFWDDTFDDIQASGILRLDKETGMPEYKDYSKWYKRDLAIFEKMVELYMLRHPRIAKKAGWSA